MSTNERENIHDFVCGECGGSEVTKVTDIALPISVRGMGNLIVKGLSGVRCACGEVELDEQSQDRYANAGDELVMAERKRIAADLRHYREELGITQIQASELTGGGHNAYSRYERGQAVPVPAVQNLFYLLSRHPALLQELKEHNKGRLTA